MRPNGLRCVFLDRDGVINRHPGDAYFVRTEEDFKILPGVIEAVRRLKDAGYAVWVLSNQSGVATGAIREEDLERITRRMRKEFQKKGVELDGVLYCPHRDQDQCKCRKPKHGLYLQVRKSMPYDSRASYTIGDSERDLTAGKAVGCKTVLVLTGKSTRSDAEYFHTEPDAIHPDLTSAAEWILDKKRS